ncbi:VOC family protein [Kitasatospora sp. NBC_00240]|uniref:VOC family protein n=1 Tax=Kitasatospora sp. NBC_00240 TaxID=2903567 RepID=UPI002257E23A|nr:VOC family protein [Kitasatospora sp. NBC_00240]MCX5208573.1 VOC family protein [Kitasatospora sp. NBC_00240]
MNITSTTVALEVGDPAASSRFFTEHLGFRELLRTDDLIQLERDDGAADILLVTSDTAVAPGPPLTGFVSFTVTGIAEAAARLVAEGVTVTSPLALQPWGGWTLGLVDPNGIDVQLAEWSAPAGAAHPAEDRTAEGAGRD